MADAVERGQPVTVNVDGEPVEVLPEEIEVRKSPKPGLAVAEDAGYLVAVTTELTDELRWEGWAREVSRNIQELRKKSGFEISDRIHTTVQAGASAGAGLGALRRRHRRRHPVGELRSGRACSPRPSPRP